MIGGEKSFNDELAEYIKKNLKKGYTRESLKQALVNNQGYSRLEVEKAMKRADQEMAAEAPILKTKPTITHKVIEPKEYAQAYEKKSFWKRLFS